MASVIGGSVLEVLAQRLSPRSWLRSQGRASRSGGADERAVAEMIEREVIPRMLLVHSNPAATVLPDVAFQPGISDDEIEAFRELPLIWDATQLIREVERYLDRGVPLQTVFLELLAPAARHLGLLWEQDRCDFVEVTMGVWRLQEVVRELSARLPVARSGTSRRALFSPMPGDAHSFGSAMIQEIFMQNGWDADYMSQPSRADLFERVAAEPFDLIGLTVLQDCHTGQLPSLIRALRSVSNNPNLAIMVGGSQITADPGLARRAGADGWASDAKEALTRAEALVASRHAAGGT